VQKAVNATSVCRLIDGTENTTNPCATPLPSVYCVQPARPGRRYKICSRHVGKGECEPHLYSTALSNSPAAGWWLPVHCYADDDSTDGSANESAACRCIWGYRTDRRGMPASRQREWGSLPFSALRSPRWTGVEAAWLRRVHTVRWGTLFQVWWQARRTHIRLHAGKPPQSGLSARWPLPSTTLDSARIWSRST